MKEAIAFCWFSRDDYPALLAIFSDSEKLPVSYDDWLARFELGKKTQEENGIPVVVVPTRPDDFTSFCDVHKMERDARARIRFAFTRGNEMLARRNRSN